MRLLPAATAAIRPRAFPGSRVTDAGPILDIRHCHGYGVRAHARPAKLRPATEKPSAMSLAEPPPRARRRREQREAERIRRAAAEASRETKSAMAAALAQIGAAFDETAVINSFKIRVERLMRLPPHHPAMRARFGARAGMLAGYDLDAAIVVIERCWREERKAFAIASALGRGTRLSLEVLSELRLILRWMRRKRMQGQYDAAVAALTDRPVAIAAE